MKEAVLLPFGDKTHIEDLLGRLAKLVTEGREEEFALLLPTSRLLHEYRHRLVRNVSRKLNLTTFDDLVAGALIHSEPKVTEIDARTAKAVVSQILAARTGVLPALGRYAGSRAMAATLVYVLGQLRRAKISIAELAQAGGALGDQVLSDLLAVYEEYQAFLEERGLADIERQYQLAAESLPAVPWLRKLKQVHVCWFFDFEPLQLDILASLASGGAEMTVWLPFEHRAHTEYLQGTVGTLQEKGFAVRRASGRGQGLLTENLFLSPPQPVEISGVRGLAAPRRKQELELIAREIKKLVNGGVRPEKICLAIPQEKEYLPLLRRSFREQAIDISVPMAVALVAVPWVQELLAVLRAAAAGWDRDSLFQVAANAYITSHLPENYDGDAVAWALESLAGNFRGQQWLDKLDREMGRLSLQLEKCADKWLQGEILQPLELYRQARPGIAAWVTGMGEEASKPKSPEEHCVFLTALLEANFSSLRPDGNSSCHLRDRGAWSKVQAAIEGYRSCSRLLQRRSPIGTGQFAEDLQAWLEGDLPLEYSSPAAVQVLSPPQIRGLSFDYVFILGLNHGSFPRANREHWLLDRVAELPGLERAQNDAALEQEKMFFHCCLASTNLGLFLTRQLPGADREAEISPFWREVDKAVAGGLPEIKLTSSDLLPPLEAVTFLRQLRERLILDSVQGKGPVDPLAWLAGQPDYPGLCYRSRAEQRRESPLPPDNMDGALSAASGEILKQRFGKAVYSISRLEQYARCPFSFYARYVLGLEAAPQPEQEYSPLDRGTLLHWLLEQFYLNYGEAAPEAVPDHLMAIAKQWLEAGGKNPEDSLWRLRVRNAVHQVEALIVADRAWQKQTGLRPVLHEATFGLPGSAVGPVCPGGGTVSFRGKIDRIDVTELGGETWAVVYDYKTSQEVTRGEIVAGNSLQIPVYLVAAPLLLANLGFTNIKVMGGGYYVLKNAKLAGGVWHKCFTQKVNSRLGSLDEQEFQQLEQTLARVSTQLHQGIIQGRFSPDPKPFACNWCDYITLCRYDKNRFRLKGGGEQDAAQC